MLGDLFVSFEPLSKIPIRVEVDLRVFIRVEVDLRVFIRVKVDLGVFIRLVIFTDGLFDLEQGIGVIHPVKIIVELLWIVLIHFLYLLLLFLYEEFGRYSLVVGGFLQSLL